MSFIKLTSAHSGILLVNMAHVISVQSDTVGFIRTKIVEPTKISVLTKLDGSTFEVTESLHDIENLLKARHGC